MNIKYIVLLDLFSVLFYFFIYFWNLDYKNRLNFGLIFL